MEDEVLPRLRPRRTSSRPRLRPPSTADEVAAASTAADKVVAEAASTAAGVMAEAASTTDKVVAETASRSHRCRDRGRGGGDRGRGRVRRSATYRRRRRVETMTAGGAARLVPLPADDTRFPRCPWRRSRRSSQRPRWTWRLFWLSGGLRAGHDSWSAAHHPTRSATATSTAAREVDAAPLAACGARLPFGRTSSAAGRAGRGRRRRARWECPDPDLIPDESQPQAR